MDLGSAGAREHKRCYTYAFESPGGGHYLLLFTNQYAKCSLPPGPRRLSLLVQRPVLHQDKEPDDFP